MSDVNTGVDPLETRHLPIQTEDALGRTSPVSWPAIFAGAVGAAALSLLLLILGTGLGLSVVSPWSMEGIGVGTFGIAAIAWLSFTQLAASGMGGYLAGRLRKKWSAVHHDEVFFRDTAHGFLAWAVASLLMVLLVTSVSTSLVSSGARAGAEVASTAAETSSGAQSTEGSDNTIGYAVDGLFRGNRTGFADDANRGASEIPVGEVTRIFAQSLRNESLSQDDQRYVGRLIAERTGLSQQQAEQRVSDGFEHVQSTLGEVEHSAREAAEEARETSAYVALWMFIALLLGAFVASLMAVFGGRQRDASIVLS